MGQTLDDIPDMTPAAQREDLDARSLTLPLGFVGLGHLGLPMAQSLLRAGHQLVACDTDPTRLAMIADGELADLVHTTTIVAEVGTRCAVVFLRLPGNVALAEVTGLLADSMAPGGLLVDLGHPDLSEARLLADALSARGLRLIEAPATGEPAAVTIVVSGDVSEVVPMLGAMGRVERA